MRIALATTRELPAMDEDDALLLAALTAVPGVEAQVLAWEADVEWAAWDLVVLRSTWNYTAHLEDFLAWAARVAAVTRLANPLPVVRWNTHKTYLADLAAAGIPVVPTAYIPPATAATAAALAGDVVVKPTVGAGSRGAALFHHQPHAAAAHVAALHAQGLTAMVQPYLEHVDTHGETALVWWGGEFSHAARKGAILSRQMSWSTGVYADEEITDTTPTAAELALARRVLDVLPDVVPGFAPLAYARVDLLPTASGPVVLEVELTEPSLFLALDGAAPARGAAVLCALGAAT